MELTAENVTETVKACLFEREEIPEFQTTEDKAKWVADNAATGKGIMRTFAFHKGRITERTADIQSMLEQLEDEFRGDKGGGWSFLNMCMRKDGMHWAEHPTMDELACLAEAAGLGGYIMREMANVMPGGMPYFQWKPRSPVVP